MGFSISTRDTTSYLKGLAIVVVMAAHYGSYYAYDFYQAWMREYASETVSIFFILAGLGSLYSFRNIEWRHGRERLSMHMVAEYYLKRALRIYPLYWLALFTIPFVLPGFDELHQLSAHTIAIYLAYPAVKAPGVYWFIPALVQCYLLAPIIHIIYKKLSLRSYLLMLAATTVFFMAVTRYYWELLAMIDGFGIPDPEALLYGPLFLSNVILFAMGLSLPRLVKSYPGSLKNGHVVLASALVMALLMYLVRDANLLFRQSHFLLFPLLMISVFGFCLTTIATGVRMPMAAVFVPLGDSSYPLYLFHRHYYGLLALAGIIVSDSLVSVMFALLFFPVFLIICRWLERAGNRFVETVSGRLRSGPATPLPEADL